MGRACALFLGTGQKASAKKLLRAVVDVIEEKTSPPPRLQTAWQCERWQCLPQAGGLMDQDYREIHEMAICLNVYNVVRQVRSAVGKEIHNIRGPQLELLKWLEDEGILYLWRKPPMSE